MKLDISVWVPFCFLSNLYWRFFFFRRINNQRPKGKIRNETWNCQRHSLNPGCRWFGLQRTTRKLYPPLRAIDWSMQDDWCKRSHADARCLAANTTVVCEGWPHLANTLLSSPGNVRRGGNPPLCIRRDSLIPSVAEPSAESPAVPTKTGLRFFFWWDRTGDMLICRTGCVMLAFFILAESFALFVDPFPPLSSTSSPQKRSLKHILQLFLRYKHTKVVSSDTHYVMSVVYWTCSM